MAHFAELDDNNVVLQVVVISNHDILDETGKENEQVGIEFCQNLFGGRWVQTSYNKNFRKHYAGEGYTYDTNRDAFIPPKPFNSWILNETTCTWEAPVVRPSNGHHLWDENILSWVLVN